MFRCAALAASAVLAAFFFGSGTAGASAAPWLFVTDIHLKAHPAGQSKPSTYGDDTDEVLFASAVAAMRRADPDPPVVVVTGDLLAHNIKRRETIPTEIRVAQVLGRAFPRAQFVLALGNEDAECGDYAIAPDSKFLRAVAGAWEPLVNRGGAAPDFRRTFVHDGFYTARLANTGMHAIVLDDTFWSPRYHAQCGSAGNAVDGTFAELQSAIRNVRGPLWLFLHVPPGIDTFSSAQVSHRTAIVPFLRPDLRDRFTETLRRANGAVTFAVAGHTHKFGYRLIGADAPHPVPMLLVPALSPIFGNNPAFLTGEVTAAGVLGAVEEWSFDGRHWGNIGGMRTLGVDAMSASELAALQERLQRDTHVRDEFERLYVAGGKPEINAVNWPIYWCAATAFTTAAFRSCADVGGVSLVTQRGVGLIVAGALFVAVALVMILRGRRKAAPKA